MSPQNQRDPYASIVRACASRCTGPAVLRCSLQKRRCRRRRGRLRCRCRRVMGLPRAPAGAAAVLELAPTCAPSPTCSCSLYFLLNFALLFWCSVIPYRVICDMGLLWRKRGVAARRNDSSVPCHRRQPILSRTRSRRAHSSPPRTLLQTSRVPWLATRACGRCGRARAVPTCAPRLQLQSVFSADLCAAFPLLGDPISCCMDC